jgi:hypothetical protein
MRSINVTSIFLICLIGCSVSEERPGPPVSDTMAKILTTIPAGFVPGAALTIKGINFFDAQSVYLDDKTSIKHSDFIMIKSDEITFLVPRGVTRLNLKVVNQYGSGELKRVDMLSGGSGLNMDNIASSTSTISMSTTNLCRDGFSVYCRKNGAAPEFIHFKINSQPGRNPYCGTPPTFESINGRLFEVFPNPADPWQKKFNYSLKFEKQGETFTGLVLMERNSVVYIGSMTFDGIILYSLLDGSIYKLCNAIPSDYQDYHYIADSLDTGNIYWKCNCN